MKKQQEFSKDANLSSATTYSNFEQTGKISLINFIKVFRAFGRISEIDNLLKTIIADKIGLTKREKKSAIINTLFWDFIKLFGIIFIS